jgi:hypothetical protein
VAELMTIELLNQAQGIQEDPRERLYKSYLEACMNIKTDIYGLLKSQHQQSEERKNQYIKEAHEVKEILQPLLDQAEIIKKDLKESIKLYKKELKEEFIKLQEQYEMGTIYINTITKRMDDLEGYIKNERFHDIVKDICELEDKFEQEAIKLVQNRMRDKK